MIADFAKRAAKAFGLAGGIAAAIVFVILLPFGLLALTRLTEWEWGIALAALIALNLIPIAGQIVYVGLAVVGAFTLGQDDLAQRVATPVAAQSVVAAAPLATADKFVEWRRTVAAPAIQKSCLEDVQRRGLAAQSQIDQMARACACYGAAAETVIMPAEMVDNKLEPSEGFNERLGNEAKRICQRE